MQVVVEERDVEMWKAKTRRRYKRKSLKSGAIHKQTRSTTSKCARDGIYIRDALQTPESQTPSPPSKRQATESPPSGL